MINLNHCLLLLALILSNSLAHAVTLQTYTPVSERLPIDLASYTSGNANFMHDLYRLFWKLNLDAEVPSIDIALDVKTGGCEAKSTKEERIFDYEYANTPTPILARETVYMCTGFEFNPPHPTNASLLATGHIVEIRPMIDPATMPYVHHYIVGACKGNTEKYRSMVGKPTECMTNGFDVMDVCPIMVYGWAVGSGPLVFPPVAGLPFGDPSDPFDTRHLLLQVHYDNQMPERTPAGLHDTSGLVIRYTFDKRQHDTALIHLGDGMVMGDPMPFGTEGKRRELEYTCPGECTALWPWDITAFASSLHMHKYGRQMWSSITSLATDPDVVTTTTDLDRTDFYEFEFQHVSHIHKVIKRGDRLNVHCVYDTSQNLFPHMRPNDTKVSFGLASEDEMCIDYIYYYPRFPNQPDNSICGMSLYLPAIP
ncbi:copper type II ascorbate-dependent monooxygenase [Jimgerdemannia flammicorona]|uniref:Copper type II ascorbate-dependent monooxygenase n=1 Tax=Jimgerdemannia flammicorona TaxID=994334 RepID=A0A433CWQ4_9FUNG|nr:copper type II ascorbate-dependent monooxygenase [Jimgerdemannia flammicorona]